ncbi:MAG: hypothetical protein R6U46_11815 [Marinilabilia sp.]
MNKRPYILKNIHIRKMPGLPFGLQKLENLASHINIISGPNASGKTSTARLIQYLIWPGKTRGMEASASLWLDQQEQWDIQIEAGNTTLYHEGREDSITGLPPATGSYRYFLALQDMVADEDKTTAEEIIRQSIGGYNLDAVTNKLDYSSFIYTKSIGQHKKLEDAFNKYHNTLSKQEKIKRQEKNLEEHYKEKEEAEHDRQRSTFFKLLSDYLETERSYNEISTKLEKFHPSMDKVNGDEFQNIEKLEAQIRHTQTAIERAHTEISELTDQHHKLSIPREGIPPEKIEELELRTENLAGLSRNIKSNEEEIEGLETEAKEHLRKIDPEIDSGQWTGLDLKDVDQLDQFIQKAHDILSHKKLLENEIDKLNREIENSRHVEYDSEKIRTAINSLSSWLNEQKPPQGHSRWLVPALISLAVISAATTFMGFWWGFGGILIMIGVWFFSTRNTSDPSSLEIRKQDFEKTGLEPPAEWQHEEVVNRLNELIQKLKETHEIEESLKNNLAQKERLETRIHDINNQYEKLKEERDALKNKIQGAPGTTQISENGLNSLVWFLDNVKKWQEKHKNLEALREKTMYLKKEYDQELAKCNQLLTQAGFPEIGDTQQAKATLSELKKQENSRKELVNQIHQLRKEIKNHQNLIDNAHNDLQNIYKNLNISLNDKNTVRNITEQLESYKALKDKFSNIKGVFENKEQVLKNHPLFPYYQAEKDRITEDEARARSEEFDQRAKKWESIVEEIKNIESAVREIKKGHELEDVLAQKEEAFGDLEDAYRENISRYTGNLIVEELKAQTREQNHPEVFREARGLFNRITAGRYELRVANNEQVAFTAYDTVLKKEQPLPELSTGTRVQLLLAVRLAFIEKQEDTIKTPLLADELLANSDDERAGAIIQAIIGISRSGRQIFYFTAQDDEVRKWHAFLANQEDINFRIIPLHGQGDNQTINQPAIPHAEELDLLPKVPYPSGKTHKEYGQELQVEPFNILTAEVSQLPLWYLIEDVEMLYSCRKAGLRYWGQMQSFRNNHGVIAGIDEEQWKKIENKARLLEHFQELYKQGRPSPISREELERSGSVTPAFMDEVADKLKELHGDPGKLISALKNGEIPKFRKNKAYELEQYLYDQNILDSREPLSSEEINIRLQAFISNTPLDAAEADRFLKRISPDKQ